MLHRLLNFLLNYLMFGSTMFFAAGAVTLTGGDAGGGAGDGSAGDSGGADSGDSGASDEGGESSDAGNDADVGDGSAADDGIAAADAADPDGPVDLGDGRTVPGKIKKLFDVAKAAGLEKEARLLYFQNQRLSKAIPGGVNGAIELANAVEQFGGVDGIEQLQSDLETYHSDSELFERGDPKWVETAFEESPDAALKAFDHSLAIVAEKHPEHYDHMMAKVVLETLDNAPIALAYSLLAGLKDNPEAQKGAQKLAAFYNSVKDTASKLPEKKVDAQQKKLSEREAQVEQREMGTRYTQVNAEVFPVMKSQVTNVLKSEAKTKGLDLGEISTQYPGEFRAMMNEIHQEIMKLALKDQRFVDKHYALVKKGDLKRAAAAVNAKHEKIVPDIVVRIAGEYGFMKGAAKKPNANSNANRNRSGTDGQQQADASWTQVSAKPDNRLIDYGKTTQSMQLDGKYILKDGKKVQVKY